jgi:endo-1,4-beta-D-glucanase Y
VTTPAAQAKFPFPQNRFGANCIRPTNYSNDDVQRAFCQWKNDTVTSSGVGACQKGGCFRVKRPNEPGTLEKDSTVSEGIAYGMLIAVYMNDQKLFDGLWKYEQQYLDQHGLMHWYIKADGTGTGSGGAGAATDADEDMAFALLMADKQWGGQGSLGRGYLDCAKDQLKNIWENEIVDSKAVKPGDGWGDWTTINISYFAPSYYKTFAAVDSGHAWNQVITASYDIIDHTLISANANQGNGLVPAWVSCGDASCSPNANAWGDKPGQSPTNYQYDSCRTPFRVGLDYCWNGTAKAKDYVAKTSAFFSGVGASKIVDGYKLDGTPQAASSGKSAAFIGTAAIGAMSSNSYQSFVDDAYASVATLQDLTGGTYYEDSWTVLSLLAMTGNFFDFTASN